MKRETGVLITGAIRPRNLSNVVTFLEGEALTLQGMSSPKKSRNADALALAIGSRIAKIRRGRGLTQLELAAACKLSVASISIIERGLSQPRIITILIIAKILGAEISELIDVSYGEGLPKGSPGPKHSICSEPDSKRIAKIVKVLEELPETKRDLVFKVISASIALAA